MFRKAIVVLYVFTWLIALITILGGNADRISTFQWTILAVGTLSLSLLWLPYRYFMKIPSLYKLDSIMWNNKVMNKFYVMLVGKKTAEQDYSEFLKRVAKKDGY